MGDHSEGQGVGGLEGEVHGLAMWAPSWSRCYFGRACQPCPRPRSVAIRRVTVGVAPAQRGVYEPLLERPTFQPIARWWHGPGWLLSPDCIEMSLCARHIAAAIADEHSPAAGANSREL